MPDASEIEVETGPYFGGRIVADSGGTATEERAECGVKGDEHSARDRYVLRIDHERCGSRVDHEQLTVRTFITVQENLGIFTHSTRRFVVVCSYQPDTLTVRASFSVPGKAAVQPHWDDEDGSTGGSSASNERSGRQRKFRMVGKDALVLKEPADAVDIEAAAAMATQAQKHAEHQQNEKEVSPVAGKSNRDPTRTSGRRTARRRMDVGDDANIAENTVDGSGDGRALKSSKYARLVHERADNDSGKNICN